MLTGLCQEPELGNPRSLQDWPAEPAPACLRNGPQVQHLEANKTGRGRVKKGNAQSKPGSLAQGMLCQQPPGQSQGPSLPAGLQPQAGWGEGGGISWRWVLSWEHWFLAKRLLVATAPPPSHPCWPPIPIRELVLPLLPRLIVCMLGEPPPHTS